MEKEMYCILAGGCFWCMARPYYEYNGIIKVYSGYSGGSEINPKYEEVKAQKTSHMESVKLIYDSSVISYKDILDIFFQTIDPFDVGGQFIDRGNSYSTAIFYHDEEMLKIAREYINNIEKIYDKKVSVKLLLEKEFYMAEEYHQDFAIKHPNEMKKELIESGRVNSIYDYLKLLNINYKEIEHKAVFTIVEALEENIINRIDGVECKNLFVKNKNHYYLIIIEGTKKTDLKKIASIVGEGKLSFASEKELKDILNLSIGSVTPLGLINDKDNLVKLLIDKELVNRKILMHPNINTKTISLEYVDLIKLIDYIEHQYILF